MQASFAEEFLELLAPRTVVNHNWQNRLAPQCRLLGASARQQVDDIQDKPREICVKLLRPPTVHRMLVRPHDTVAYIVSKLVSRGVATDASAIRLILKGKVLSTTQTIAEANLLSGTTIHATVKAVQGIAPGQDSPKSVPSQPPVAGLEKRAPNLPAELNSELFWTALSEHLCERLSNTADADAVLQLFRNAWLAANTT